MTAQDHIDAIGAAQAALDATLVELRDEAKLAAEHADNAKLLAKRANKEARRVHYLQDKAQRAFKEAYPEDNIVLFSGGTDKPPVDDPDEPVDP